MHPPEDTTYDLIVLGAGSGGLAASKRAASLGARVLIIESKRIGGTCVLRGCIPKKVMAYAAEMGHARRLAPAYGWAAAPAEHSWPTLCAARDALLQRLADGHRSQLVKSGITVVSGTAAFCDPHTVQVGSTRFSARHVLISTGGSPYRPNWPGVEHTIDSDAFFRLPQRPQAVVIVGGGYIAVEFACMLHALGSQVTLVARSKLLRGFDHQIADHVRQSMQRSGITVLEATDVEGVELAAGCSTKAVVNPQGHNAAKPDAHGEKRQVTVRSGQTHEVLQADCVVIATGRRPDTNTLNLPAAGVEVDAHAAVVVDHAHRTATPHIFAVGDVINRVNLTPIAIRAGRSVAEGLFGERHIPVDYANVPTAVFSHPPVGAVGLTESQARDKHGTQVQVYSSTFSPLRYAIMAQQDKVPALMKLIVHADTDRVLGMHMAGDDAPEIIQGFAAAMQAGVTKQQLDSTVAMHPTSAEEFVLMR
jgi:glutathione reductase (NADPH)